jgi:hypothetical protein
MQRCHHGTVQSSDVRRLCRLRREVVGFPEIPQAREAEACDITATEPKNRYRNNSWNYIFLPCRLYVAPPDMSHSIKHIATKIHGARIQ